MQGLRALAVLLVVAFHADLPVPGGFVGVDVFFVISGFVITAKLLREHGREERIGLVAFYSGRVRRILPALAVMTSIVAVASVFFLSPLGPRQDTITTGVAASLFSANYQLLASANGYFDTPAASNALLHTWSLSVEEQFYLVFPALLWVLLRLADRPGRRHYVGLGLVALGAGSFILWSALTVYSEEIAFYGSFARAWEFIVGALLALLVDKAEKIGRRASVYAQVAGAALILVPAITASSSSAFPGASALVGHRAEYLPGPLPLIPVIGTALLIAGGSSVRARAVVLSSTPAQRIGDLSYSWYLWHWPLIVFAVALAPDSEWVAAGAAAFSIVPAWASYRVVETRFRFDAGIRGRRALRVGATCVAIPIAFCLLAAPMFGGLAPASLEQLEDEAGPRHADVEHGCDSDTPFGDRGESCYWRVEDAQGEILLFGDSNAGHFTEPLAQATNALGFDLAVATNSGCPPIDVVISKVSSRTEDGSCRRFYEESLQHASEHPPSAVVLAFAADRYVRGTSDEGLPFDVRRPDSDESGDRASRTDAITSGLTSTIAALESADIPVLVLQTLPHLRWSPGTCSIVRELAATNGCVGEPLPLTTLDEDTIAGRQSILDVARTSGVQVLDLTSDVCATEGCSPWNDGHWIYRDGGHLSVTGALTLTAPIEEALGTAVARQEPAE